MRQETLELTSKYSLSQPISTSNTYQRIILGMTYPGPTLTPSRQAVPHYYYITNGNQTRISQLPSECATTTPQSPYLYQTKPVREREGEYPQCFRNGLSSDSKPPSVTPQRSLPARS
ncbi:hypothetical protein J6590_064661 [Homalodisca vitripennis]|nr:hypothetical protein J6590_064661 [Homalodisca vitripennis]